jgi:Protein of unknown function (DUF1071)
MEYKELRSIDVSKYTEKKNGLTYLSWAWAVDQLLLADPKAHWFYPEFQRWGNGTVMVFCTVVANDIARTAQLPVMDYRNKPIAEPDSFAVNTAMQRALAKAIALHGIGLYIYNGEDIPPELGNDVTMVETKPVTKSITIEAKPAEATITIAKPEDKSLFASEKVSAKLPGEWTLKPTEKDFIGSLNVGLEAMLQLAASPEDVANIFKVNRSAFDKAKAQDLDAYNEMMAKFTVTKKSLTKE